ncbi:hypothetical protein [Kitasatospora aureofaciens]
MPVRGGGFADGGQAFAPYVADHHADCVVGSVGGVQVAADLGLVFCGQVQAGDLQRADPFRQGPHQDVLGGLGDRTDLCQLRLAALTCHAEEDDQAGQHP